MSAATVLGRSLTVLAGACVHAVALLAAFLHLYSHVIPHLTSLQSGHPAPHAYRDGAWVVGAGAAAFLVGLLAVRRGSHGLVRVLGVALLVGIDVAVHLLHVADSGPAPLACGGAGAALVFVGGFERVGATLGLVAVVAANAAVDHRWSGLRPDGSRNWPQYAARYDHLTLAIAVVLTVSAWVFAMLARPRHDDEPYPLDSDVGYLPFDGGGTAGRRLGDGVATYPG